MQIVIRLVDAHSDLGGKSISKRDKKIPKGIELSPKFLVCRKFIPFQTALAVIVLVYVFKFAPIVLVIVQFGSKTVLQFVMGKAEIARKLGPKAIAMGIFVQNTKGSGFVMI